ncbi:MAG: Gfo/Idh/MocA family protein [Casimicrobium sp.]
MNSSAMSSKRSIPRVAMIGAGYFSQFHLRGWRQCGAKVVALCDTNRDRALAAAKQFDVDDVYDDANALLLRDDIDLVDIALPPAHQFDVVNAALERAVPVICQKPFAMSYAQAQRLVMRAEQMGAPLIVHENFRFMPWYREAKRFIESGRLGKPHSVLFRLRPGDGQGADAYLNRQPYFQTMPRFLVVETAVHFIDTFRFLMGEVVAVSARLRRVNPHIKGEDAGVMTFEFESGAMGLLDANRCNDHSAVNARRTMGEMWLEGEYGCLRLDGDGQLWWKAHGEAEIAHVYDAGSTSADDFGGGACAALQASALSAFFGNARAENTAADYLTNIRIQEAIYQSHETGQRIETKSFSPPIDPLIPTL